MKYFAKMDPEYSSNVDEQMFNKVRKQLLKRDILRLKNAQAQSQQINWNEILIQNIMNQYFDNFNMIDHYW